MNNQFDMSNLPPNMEIGPNGLRGKVPERLIVTPNSITVTCSMSTVGQNTSDADDIKYAKWMDAEKDLFQVLVSIIGTGNFRVVSLGEWEQLPLTHEWMGPVSYARTIVLQPMEIGVTT